MAPSEIWEFTAWDLSFWFGQAERIAGEDEAQPDH
jgi:hypothetical protein